MPRSFAITLGILALGSCVAQDTFEKYYDGIGTSKFNLNEQTDGKLITGIAYQSGTSLMDSAGNILNTHCYHITPLLVLQSVRRLDDSEFYFTGGYYKDSCSTAGTVTIPHTDPVIGRIDAMGNILALSHYRLNTLTCWNLAGDITVLQDSGAVVWDRDRAFFIVRAAADLSHLWSKHFDHEGGVQFVKELPGGDLLAGINMDTARVVVARLSPDGTFIWCRSYFRPKGMIHDCLIESDDSFLITGVTDSLHAAHPPLFFMKLNGSGDVQWCKGYNTGPGWKPDQVSHIARTNDGSYVVLATSFSTGASARPFLMKLNTNGDTLWTRSAGAGTHFFYAYDLLASADGGYLYSGLSSDYNTFIFKTDSLGHLPCSEKVPPPLTISDLFPVDSAFTLTSVDGATALPGISQDTTYDPVVIYDGCTITSLQQFPQPQKLRVQPNPTSGHFTVSFPDPLTAESYYAVYDTSGRLLYQRPLPKGQLTEEVDLSRFGKGTYLLKVTAPEGVCYERVVVE